MTRAQAGVLDEIVRVKREEIAALDQGRPIATRFSPRGSLVRERLQRSPARGARGALRLIAEIKRRSPSAGALSTKLSVGARAVAYARGGAAMVSVLCDTTFFDGGYIHLTESRSAFSEAGIEDVAILAKEFVLSPRQIDEAVARGADAVLLIVRIVDPKTLGELVAHAKSAGLEPLVEVATEDELRVAIDAGAGTIGVNARDLDTLAMDAERAAKVLAGIPATSIAIHLSGLKTAGDVAAIAKTRADAALIGEALMREDDPAALLASMHAAAAATL